MDEHAKKLHALAQAHGLTLQQVISILEQGLPVLLQILKNFPPPQGNPPAGS